MIGLFFEVQTKPGLRDRYMDLAASLKPKLAAMGGCLFIDRFQSLTRENLLFSYQIWQDEGAMTAWRADACHHGVQKIGREKVFSDYRIRIAQVIYEARPGQQIGSPNGGRPIMTLKASANITSLRRNRRAQRLPLKPMASRNFRQHVSGRLFCAPDRFAGPSIRPRIRSTAVYRSDN